MTRLLTKRVTMSGAWLLGLWLTLHALPRAEGDPAPASPSPRAQIGQPARLDFVLPRLGAGPGALPMDLARQKADDGGTVLFFLSEQCGVTYFYRARLQRVERDFAGRGFTFVGVRCGRKEHPEAPVVLPETKYLKMPFVDDAAGDMTRYYGVGQSLTFAVIDRAGRLRYRGGFDDSVDEGDVHHPYLRDALRALTAGKPVTKPVGLAIGCAIVPVGQKN